MHSFWLNGVVYVLCVYLIDRYTVVLQIFNFRARTKEARLQVALAELPYLRYFSQSIIYCFIDIIVVIMTLWQGIVVLQWNWTERQSTLKSAQNKATVKRKRCKNKKTANNVACTWKIQHLLFHVKEWSVLKSPLIFVTLLIVDYDVFGNDTRPSSFW